MSSTASAPGLQISPLQQSQSSGLGQHKFRTLTDIYNSTEEMLDFEYSGVCMLAADEPSSVEQALEQGCWRKAMEEELNSILSNQTWEPAELPKDHKVIGLKWVFKIKKDPAGNIVKHKARLVAKGYAQIQGVDYDEVFAPVARLEIVRVLIALAAQREWEIHHILVTRFPERWERGTGTRNAVRLLKQHGTLRGIQLIDVHSMRGTCSQRFRNEVRERL
jgi:hypothetical protein